MSTCKQIMTNTTCNIWDMTTSEDEIYLGSVANEAVMISGATINVHKLLGIHEQQKLTDFSGFGRAISSGDMPFAPASNAFDITVSYWKSSVSGVRVTGVGYVGYDFGTRKLPNGREMYGIDASIRRNISTIRIKQALEPNRVLEARVERSDDGISWYGVDKITIPNNDSLHTIHFKSSVPSRYWRLRPTIFNGRSCDEWVVHCLEFHEFTKTDLSNIQDRILLENRDRSYSPLPDKLKGTYNPPETNLDLTKFGLVVPTSYTLTINFLYCVATLGRPIVIGDILELPSELMYTSTMVPVKRFLEVTNVAWDTTSYAPGYKPLFLRVTAEPAVSSQETQDIFGSLHKQTDDSGLFDKGDGNNTQIQDISQIDHTIRAESSTLVPQLGSNGSNDFREFTVEDTAHVKPSEVDTLKRINFNSTFTYVEDALPQNGEKYTSGPDFPPTPADGDYHRVEYVGTAQQIPARLFKYSAAKNKWIFMESDKRSLNNSTKPLFNEFLKK